MCEKNFRVGLSFCIVCERPLRRYPLWHSVKGLKVGIPFGMCVKDLWASIAFGIVRERP
jgi:hypothetical protein